MPRFRKRPVVIEAFQWRNEPGDYEIMPKWLKDAFVDGNIKVVSIVGPDGVEIRIETLEGAMAGKVGDWIIRGIRGELYSCRADIFEATYEPV